MIWNGSHTLLGNDEHRRFVSTSGRHEDSNDYVVLVWRKSERRQPEHYERGSLLGFKWAIHFGGIDSPAGRKFTPTENPYYCALPYGDLNERDKLKKTASLYVPWYRTWDRQTPLLKNHWVKIIYRGRRCYAQWADVGPFGENDYEWVFGNASRPKSKINKHAGLDVSPDVWKFLCMRGNALTDFEHVALEDVPDGPWLNIITSSKGDRGVG